MKRIKRRNTPEATNGRKKENKKTKKEESEIRKIYNIRLLPSIVKKVDFIAVELGMNRNRVIEQMMEEAIARKRKND